MIRKFTISGIAATNQQNLLGIDGFMPWGRIKRDLKFYKSMTVGKSLVCGGNTFRSLPPQAFISRQLFVISRQPVPENLPDNVIFINELVCPGHIIDHIEPLAISNELMVIGGGMIYRVFEEQYDKFYLTKINGPDFDINKNDVVYFEADLSKRSSQLKWSEKILDQFDEENSLGKFNVKIVEMS